MPINPTLGILLYRNLMEGLIKKENPCRIGWKPRRGKGFTVLNNTILKYLS